MENKILVKNFLEDTGVIDLQIRLVAGESGLAREIRIGDINRPGLTLAGFYDFFAYDRIQIFGLGESAYLRQLSDDDKRDVLTKFFSYDVLCCVFTHDEEPDSLFLEFADRKGVPVLVTRKDTTKFISSLIYLLNEAFAPTITMHGTFVDVYGIGVLLIGKSGVGKSECALELVERGHRFIADDVVVIKRVDESILMGGGSPLLKHHMEIRGLGIINVKDIFGIRSVRDRKRVELVVILEEWVQNKEYDRLGLEEQTYSILDIDVASIMVPVRPGRNIPIIVETAALNQRLKKLGIFTARELDRNIQENLMRGKKIK
ncbi:MAG TPA: HPr(Ser) kinase/phosphatase [Spirochaetota bacterium]|nr:HPr(Ser) kinase/phosphatase [Spirochaetota bacterium]HPV43237.1 HPr(Ser) kinase/phosphatase [Spirochaetota bacterium]